MSNIVYNPNSAYVKEMRKWEQYPSQYTWNPETGQHECGNKWVYREYPKMLYRAHEVRGDILCMKPPPNFIDFSTNAEYERAVLANETWNRSCYIIVANEEEERREKNKGYFESQPEAIEALKQRAEHIATASAEANYRVATMSEKAQREWDEAGKQNFQHVTDVKGAAKSARGSDRKVTGVVDKPELD